MKSSKQTVIDEVHEKFSRIVKLYETLEKTPKSYGTDERFSSSEMRLIEIIGDKDEELSVTDLAKWLNVTKGAVSQSLKKLEARSLTRKEPDPENVSRSIAKLTSKGKVAYFAHRHWHETMDGGYKDYYTSLEEDKIVFLLEFMERVEIFLQRAIATEK